MGDIYYTIYLSQVWVEIIDSLVDQALDAVLIHLCVSSHGQPMMNKTVRR